MNRRAKGNRNELKAVKELEADGYITYRVKGSTNRFQKNVDIFGLFDILGKRKEQMIWVQVKSNKKPSLKPFVEFYKKYCSGLDSVEIWVYKDRKGVEKHQIK